MLTVEKLKDYGADVEKGLARCANNEALYLRLKEAGCDVTARYVDGAEHEGNFWSPEVRREIHTALCGWLLS